MVLSLRNPGLGFDPASQALQFGDFLLANAFFPYVFNDFSVDAFELSGSVELELEVVRSIEKHSVENATSQLVLNHARGRYIGRIGTHRSICKHARIEISHAIESILEQLDVEWRQVDRSRLFDERSDQHAEIFRLDKRLRL